MMSNLFSIFDPTTSGLFNMNWTSSMLSILTPPVIFWFNKSRLIIFYSSIYLLIHLEFKLILSKKFNYMNTIFFVTLFVFILLNNLMGLFPYIFTSTSHLILPLTFSITLWLSVMISGWSNNMDFMFSHMIPQGTPNILMPFMVLIETISNIIRPGTLAIRLTANMIAGHLLLTLLSNASISPFLLITIIIILIQIILLTLEFSVSIIQAYVFSILSTLYTKEITYE